MIKKRYHSLLLACILLVPAARVMAAAPFLLPDDTILDIQPFTFPESARSDSEPDLPEALRLQIADALKLAGISVRHARDVSSGAVPGTTDTPMPESSDSVKTTPLAEKQEPESDGTTSREFDAPLDEDPAKPQIPVLAPPEDTPKTPETALPATPVLSPPHPGAGNPTHILSGNVTLFRETIGAPTRIAGTIRIRAETSLHCAYTVKDAATGRVIISNVASGSSAKITAQLQDIDAILASQTARALTLTAENLAEDLSGVSTGKDTARDMEYYRDSPGKRLKQEP